MVGASAGQALRLGTGQTPPCCHHSRDSFNRSEIQTTLCALITSNLKLAGAAANILLEKSISGLGRTSVINFSQIFTIDKPRLTDLVSMLPKDYIVKINANVRYIFDAEP
ncbi:MAG: type II toxin-antitoxin system PemK/MazF family toxin [Treponematales bacterium]|jgi:mRNA interferase MazF